MNKINKELSLILAIICLINLGFLRKNTKEESPSTNVVYENEYIPPTDDIIEPTEKIENNIKETQNIIETPPNTIKIENVTMDDNEYEKTNDFAYIIQNSSIFDTDKENKVVSENVDKYQKILRLETNDKYSLVQTESLTIGYIENTNINVLPDLFVEIDISDQTINLYKDYNVLLTSLVVTGKDSTPTRIGYFPIAYKVYDTYLRGSGYNVHVNYWMPFDGGIGLHDASWRSEFGGTIYQSSGSHGCVNLPNDVAKTIYENVETGDYVLVHH